MADERQDIVCEPFDFAVLMLMLPSRDQQEYHHVHCQPYPETNH